MFEVGEDGVVANVNAYASTFGVGFSSGEFGFDGFGKGAFEDFIGGFLSENEGYFKEFVAWKEVNDDSFGVF